MQKYLIAGLCSALLVLGWLYRMTNEELADTKTSLAVAVEANKTNQEAIYFEVDRDVEPGTFVTVRLTGVMDGELTGELVEE